MQLGLMLQHACVVVVWLCDMEYGSVVWLGVAYEGVVLSMEVWCVLWVMDVCSNCCMDRGIGYWGSLYCTVVQGLGKCGGGVKYGILTWCILGVMRSSCHNLHLQLLIYQLAQKCKAVESLG